MGLGQGLNSAREWCKANSIFWSSHKNDVFWRAYGDSTAALILMPGRVRWSHAGMRTTVVHRSF
jgi:hypothetical protein